jgi:hypothetical protein
MEQLVVYATHALSCSQALHSHIRFRALASSISILYSLSKGTHSCVTPAQFFPFVFGMSKRQLAYNASYLKPQAYYSEALSPSIRSIICIKGSPSTIAIYLYSKYTGAQKDTHND